jgi:hypothetical protein
MYQPYADAEYYHDVYGGNSLPEEELPGALRKASRHIDALTYNRIVGMGISGLTEYQQDIIKECCCEMAEFEYENQDMLESILKNYAINGVSMSFGEGWNIKTVNGVATKRDCYARLESTGLTSRKIGR